LIPHKERPEAFAEYREQMRAGKEAKEVLP
jgi:hypothetical protein